MQLIDLIYDAVADGSRWQVFLEAFARAVNAPKGSLGILDSRWDGFAISCWHGWSADDIRLYVERYTSDDPLVKAGWRIAEGQVGTNFDLCPEDEWAVCRVNREFYAPRAAEYGLGGTILRSETAQANIIAGRGKAEGPFGESELSVLRPLMPHLKRAAVLHGEFSSLQSRLSAFTGHVDHYPYGFALTDEERRVLYMNPAASEITQRRDGLRIEGGRLLASGSREDAALQEAATATAAERGTGLRRLSITRPSHRMAYRLMLIAVGKPLGIPFGAFQPPVAILIVDAESAPALEPGVLRELFSLTAAEARIASMLVQGQSIEEIAAGIHVSVETVRTHVRRLLSKTGTSRQGELIALLLRSAPFGHI